MSCIVGNNNDPNFKNDNSEQVNTKHNINGTRNQWRFLEIQDTKYYDNKIDDTCDDGTNQPNYNCNTMTEIGTKD